MSYHPTVIRDAIKAEKARRSFREFVRQAWPHVNPSFPLIHGWYIDAICDHLQAVKEGDILKLLVNMPPGLAKSLLISVLFPAWVWIDWPEFQSLHASYDEKLSKRDSIKSRGLIESKWYRENFVDTLPEPEDFDNPKKGERWTLSDDQNEKGLFKNTRTGFRLSISVNGGTGQRGDAVLIDDPISASKVLSKSERDNVKEWIPNTAMSRVNDRRIGIFIMVMQRLHAEDPSQVVLDLGGWEHLKLPAEFNPKKRCITYIRKPLLTRDERNALIVSGNAPEELPTAPPKEFWRDPRTEAGELLAPKLLSESVLAESRKVPSTHAAQMNQEPNPPGGHVFDPAWWRFWKPDGVHSDGNTPRPDGCSAYPARALPEKFDRLIIVADMNFKEGVKNDFVAVHKWGAKGADRYLLDRVKGRWGFPETKRNFKSFCERHADARKKLVEDKANGPAIVAELKSDIPGLIEWSPNEFGSKEARAAAVSPEVESGNVYLPEGAPWLAEYIEETKGFPHAKNDDEVDCTSMALLELQPSSAVERAKKLAK